MYTAFETGADIGYIFFEKTASAGCGEIGEIGAVKGALMIEMCFFTCNFIKTVIY